MLMKRRLTTRPIALIAALGLVCAAFAVVAGPANAAPRASATVSPPDTPTNVKAVAGDAQVRLSWTAPANNGGSPITEYDVYVGTSTQNEDSDLCYGPKTTCTVTGLGNGTTYYFTVGASNSAGESDRSTETSATPVAPAGAPAAPTGLAAVGGPDQVTLTWTAPANHGSSPITGYKAYAAPDRGEESLAPADSCETNGSTTRCVMTSYSGGNDFVGGQPYWFTVVAVNAAGVSPLASPDVSATPTATVPGAPSDVFAEGGANQVTVSWTASTTNGGSSITGYAVYAASASGQENLAAATSCTTDADTATCAVTKDQNGAALAGGTTYWFTVVALNSVGHSAPASPDASATTASVPDSPDTVSTAVVGPSQVQVSWTAPDADGGSPVTSYQVLAASASGQESSASPASCTASATATSCVATMDQNGAALTNGTTYWFSVEAVNAVGHSAMAVPDASATPLAGVTVPNAPTNLRATSGDESATLTWSAPTSDGNSPITGYAVYGSTSRGDELQANAPVCTASASAHSCSVTDLTNGTTFYFEVLASNAAGASAPSNEAAVVPAPTPTLTSKYADVAKGATQALAGVVAPGASVSLYSGKTRLAVTKANARGGYSFTRTFTTTASYDVTSLGKTSRTLTVGVVALTVSVAGKQPLKAGTYTFSGDAPRGLAVELERDGNVVARTTASSRNAYAVRLKLTATHKYRIVCDGVASAAITVRVR
jgi:fibronectin type 3 domain-containing protein